MFFERWNFSQIAHLRAGSQLERILREFPWLWGLNKDWASEHNYIRVESADRLLFSQPVESASDYLVAIFCRQDGRQCLRILTKQAGVTLGRAICTSVRSGESIEFVAFAEKDFRLVTISRKPSGFSSLHEFLFKLLKEEIPF